MNSKNIKVFEPIYNDFFFNYLTEKSKLRKEIDEKFGSNDGIVMNLVNRKIDLKQYKMKCEIMGCLDYNVPLLQRIISYYDKLYSLPGYRYFSNLDEEIKQYILKLKTNITYIT